jgi:hypothetical protein
VVPVQPEAVASSAAPSNSPPIQLVPATQNVAIDDSAPVDRRLMQRGFSHAFDSLLQPTDPPKSAALISPAAEGKP